MGLPRLSILGMALALLQAYLTEHQKNGKRNLIPIKNVQVENFVCHGVLDKPADLTCLKDLRPNHVTYVKSVFPGARVALGRNISVNLYESGKYVIAGQKSIQDFNRAANDFVQFLKETPNLKYIEEPPKPKPKRKRKSKNKKCGRDNPAFGGSYG